MKRRVALLSILATLALIGATMVPAGAGPGRSPAGSKAGLQMYTVLADQAGAKAIKSGGYDIASVESTRSGGTRLEIVAYPSDRAALEKFGTVRLWRNADGLTSSQLAVQQAAAASRCGATTTAPTGSCSTCRASRQRTRASSSSRPSGPPCRSGQSSRSG